jgi:adenine deaminase
VAGGPQDDHEGTRVEDVIARARQGMKVMMRYGSAWHDVAAQVKAITEHNLSTRAFLLCADDIQSATLVSEGHMDRAVRHAIDEGLAPMTAIQMATINTAEHFGVSREMGMIAPGRYGDVLIVKNLYDLKPDVVIAKGKEVVRNGEILIDLPKCIYPTWVVQSVHLKHPMTAVDFLLKSNNGDTARAHVIGVIENQAPTRHLVMQLPVIDGEIKTDIEKDIAKVALVERHRPTGRVQVGLVNGFGFTTKCAVATTVAHDSHQMIVVGTDEEDMAFAANYLAEIEGGQVIVSGKKVIGEIKLPIGGLMSKESAKAVALQAQNLLDGFRKCGCKINNPNMQLSLLGLVVIPELRISDLGLVDVNRFDFIPVIDAEN